MNCPKCNKELDGEASVCDVCGAEIKNTQPDGAKPEPKEAKPSLWQKIKAIPKMWFVLGACALAAIVLGIVLVTVLVGGSKKPNYTLYLKDDQLYYKALPDGDELQVTKKLVEEGYLSNGSYVNIFTSSMNSFTTVSKDGKRIFFPDKTNDTNGGFSLYCLELSDPLQTLAKIGTNITYYTVNDDATLITYFKRDESTVYQYSLAAGDDEKIADKIVAYNVSDDGKTVIYRNEEGGLYAHFIGTDREKLDSDVTEITYVSENFETVYYKKSNELYRKAIGSEPVKISSDVYSVLKVYDSGAIYFLKYEQEQKAFSDFVFDDVKETDSAMKAPSEPIAPSVNDYATTEEYAAAYEQYQNLYTAYLSAKSAYDAKLARDVLREALAERTLTQSSYALFFYDGKSATLVTDGYDDYKAISADAPVMVFDVYNTSSYVKVKITEISDIDSVEPMINAALYSSSDTYATQGASLSLIQDIDAKRYSVSAAGDKIYYVDDIEEGKNYGNLYQIKIENGKIGKAEVYDSEVSSVYTFFTKNDKLVYFKDVDSDDYYGELYIDKKKVDFDVALYTVKYVEEFDKLIYLTDYDYEKQQGTLKLHMNEKTVMISDDVHSFELSAAGDILYLKDYSINYCRGDLYTFNGKTSEKLAIDVVAILTAYINED